MSDALHISPTARKFGYPQTLIAETRDWLVLLRPQQVTLGSLVLLCREPVTAFGDVSPGALECLHPVLKRTERMLQDMVSYQKINYLMLMMVDPDVHFHVFPRYEGMREYHGQTLADAGWPGPPRLDSGVALPVELQNALAADLRARWGGA